MSSNKQSKRPGPPRLAPGGFFRPTPPILYRRKKPLQKTGFQARSNAPHSSFAKLFPTLKAAGRQEAQ